MGAFPIAIPVEKFLNRPFPGTKLDMPRLDPPRGPWQTQRALTAEFNFVKILLEDAPPTDCIQAKAGLQALLLHAAGRPEIGDWRTAYRYG